MNIADLFKKKTVFSFEVFPPKKESGVETIYKTLEELKQLNPDFISVTYGAGGVGVANATTVDLCSKIKNEYGIETIAHLTCLYNTKEDIDRILEELKENHDVVITIEDGILDGGFGEKISRFYGPTDMKVINYGLKKEFLDRYDVNEVLRENHLTKEEIVEDVMALMK